MLNQENQPSAAEQINQLNEELMKARAEAYEARTALDNAETQIKAIKNALSGAAVGAQFESDRATQEAAKEETPEAPKPMPVPKAKTVDGNPNDVK